MNSTTLGDCGTAMLFHTFSGIETHIKAAGLNVLLIPADTIETYCHLPQAPEGPKDALPNECVVFVSVIPAIGVPYEGGI